MRIERIGVGSVAAYREVRLAALAFDPMAFSSTYERESALSDAEWQPRAAALDGRDRVGFFAVDDAAGGAVCGLVLCFRPDDEPAVGNVISMWVSPEARRKGAGSALLAAIAEWAPARGISTLRLFVLANNPRAIALYEKHGYQMTGRAQPYPNDASLVEVEMERAIG